MGGKEEGRIGIATEVMAKDVEGTRGIAEGGGDLFGGAPFEEEGAKGLVLAVFGGGWLGEEALERAYVFWLSYRHIATVLHTTCGVKGDFGSQE